MHFSVPDASNKSLPRLTIRFFESGEFGNGKREGEAEKVVLSHVLLVSAVTARLVRVLSAQCAEDLVRDLRDFQHFFKDLEAKIFRRFQEEQNRRDYRFWELKTSFFISSVRE